MINDKAVAAVAAPTIIKSKLSIILDKLIIN